MARTKPVQSDSSQPRRADCLGRVEQFLATHGKSLMVLCGYVVMALGITWGCIGLWSHFGPQVTRDGRYRIPGEKITSSETPEWLTADIRGEVLCNAELDGRLSILDEHFVPAVKNAFEMHPWIASVDRIVKGYPASLHVELTYRKPVAVVELAGREGMLLLPVDSNGIHLPAEDVPLARRRRLPRISGIVGRPPTGQEWDDPRVAGAVLLADRLAPVWQSLCLVDILPSARPEIRTDRRYFLYDLVTRGGTRIIWGAAPGTGTTDETDFRTKLARLTQCVKQFGPLDSVRSPAEINIRQGVSVSPRPAKKPSMAPETLLIIGL